MEGRSPKYKVALDALLVVEKFISSINAESCRDFCEYLRAERNAKELLNQTSLPAEVRRAVDRVILAVLDIYIATIKILEAENKRNIERLKEENRQKGEQIWRRIGKGVTLILYVLVMFGMYWKENWTLVFLCIPISFIEKLLLNDTFAARLWAWILTKTKNNER